jgi:hypothetical protein
MLLPLSRCASRTTSSCSAPDIDTNLDPQNPNRLDFERFGFSHREEFPKDTLDFQCAVSLIITPGLELNM